MPKELTLSLNNQLVPISIEKVDRSDLYGQINSEMLDAGVQCTRVQVLIDGTILAPKSTVKALLINGFWIEEQELRRMTPEGREMVKQESSFKSPPVVKLHGTASLLGFCVKSVYTVDGHTQDGDYLQWFDFNYTAGYPKPAFLLQGADGNGYMLIGEPAQCSWVGHQDFCLTGETEEWEEDDIEALFN